ncbi:cytochrome c oxidase subunit I [Salinisphaera sp. PC39]|uniref:cytochrome c oxidase subunit I n=1 Tax=Salinisphaera sp. PC39 TaxID=1304156 RepID=UPI00333EFF1E
MSTVNPADTHHDDHHHHGPVTLKDGFFKWCMRWISTTNHKDLGTLYLVFSFTMLFIGGLMSLVIRAELFAPGIQYVDPEFYNQMITLHALVMIFGGIMPGFVGLANWMVPMMIGCSDLALPRVNNWGFWILPFAFTLLLSTLFIDSGAPAAGWTMYPPLVLQSGDSLPLMILAIHMMGVSSITGAINVVVTILNMRAPGMTLLKMPLFVWTWLITAYLLIAVMPVLAGAVTMLLTDRYFGTSFFSAAGGGDPVMYQHIFWFFGHPEVYIMILPAFGIISMIIPTFARKPLFGYDSMVYATASIAFLSFIVWAHHMFTVGMPVAGELFFMFSTMLIAVPTGVKVFNWVATMWRGSMSFETPMLFALGFVFLFTIGGFSGLMLAITPVDFQYHDSYFVVAHFHYVLVPGALFSIIAAIYYWIPKWTGVMYNEKLGQFHFWWSTVWINVLFFPQHFLGLAGMPRRIPDYSTQFADFNMVSSVGAFMFFIGQFPFAYNMIQCMRGKGQAATDRVWEGARGLEWTVPSPAPYHTFETPPKIDPKEVTSAAEQHA